MGKAIFVYFSLVLNMLITTSMGSDERRLGKTPNPCVFPEKYIQIEVTSEEGHLSRLDIWRKQYLSKLDISPDGRYLLGLSPQKVLLWDIETGKVVHTYSVPAWPFFMPSGQIAFFREGELLVSRSGKWDEFSTAARLKPGPVSPDGRYIANFEFPGDDPWSLGYRVSFYQIPSGQKVSTLPPFKAHASWHAFSYDNEFFAVATDDGKLTVWRVKDGQLIGTFEQGSQLRKDPVTREEAEVVAIADNLAFSPDGKILASANADSTLRLWDVATGKLWKSFELGIDQIVFTPDGRVLIAAGIEHFFVWALQQEKEICHDREGYVRKMALSANGKVLAVYEGPSRGRIAIYDVSKLVQGKDRSPNAEK